MIRRKALTVSYASLICHTFDGVTPVSKLCSIDSPYLKMPTDSASVLELARAIGKVVNKLTNAGSVLSNSDRQALVINAERLAIAAREPEENLYFQATHVWLLYGWKKQEITVGNVHWLLSSFRPLKMLPSGPLSIWAFSIRYLSLVAASVWQTSPHYSRLTSVFSVSQRHL